MGQFCNLFIENGQNYNKPDNLQTWNFKLPVFLFQIISHVLIPQNLRYRGWETTNLQETDGQVLSLYHWNNWKFLWRTYTWKNDNGVCTQITYHPIPCTLCRSLPEVYKGSLKILCNILKTSLESRRDILRCSSKLENFLLTTDIDITYQEGSSQKIHDKSKIIMLIVSNMKQNISFPHILQNQR